jgi:predicted ATP-grasp superfamily ATP-dependent carboligase
MKTTSKTSGFSVLIPDGGETYSLSVVSCLAVESNIRYFFLTKDKHDSIRFSRHVSKFIPYPGQETEELALQAIIDSINKTKADVLLPVGIDTIRLVSKHKETLSKLISCAPVPGVEAFDTAHDKWLLAQWLKENDVPHPSTTLFTSSHNVEELISSVEFPIIVKPRNGSGGVGIYIFREVNKFREWYADFKHTEDLIVQSYIKGHDIDCSILCQEGKVLAHTIQKSIKYSEDYPWPYGLEFLEHSEILGIAEDVARKFNWSGVVHIDLRYDEVEQRTKLIEMNPRFWASVNASVFSGVNFPYLSCLTALNREIPPVNPQRKVILRTGPAIKTSFRKLFRKKDTLSYDNTFLEFILKDPLPTIIEEALYYYKKIKDGQK